jgi:hypothetical protein
MIQGVEAPRLPLSVIPSDRRERGIPISTDLKYLSRILKMPIGIPPQGFALLRENGNNQDLRNRLM